MISWTLAALDTPVGDFAAIFTARGKLVALAFPEPGAEAAGVTAVRLALRAHGAPPDGAGESMSRNDNCPGSAFVRRQLVHYFQGRPIDFDAPLEIGARHPFDRSVWEAARRIPFGERRTYGDIAHSLGKSGASRAVGAALGRNPIPLFIPCHRVTAAGGRLGGFSGGLHWKERLLELEGKSPR